MPNNYLLSHLGSLISFFLTQGSPLNHKFNSDCPNNKSIINSKKIFIKIACFFSFFPSLMI